MPVLERGLTSRVLCHPGHGSPGNLSASEACSPVQTPSPCQEQSCLYGTRLPFHLQAKAAVGALMGCKGGFLPKLEKPDRQPGPPWQALGLPAGV